MIVLIEIFIKKLESYELDESGCPICDCRPTPECGPVCKIYCPHGNVLDESGCPTCACKPPPECGPVCKIYCPYGNVLDSNGCPICECKPEPVSTKRKKWLNQIIYNG